MNYIYWLSQIQHLETSLVGDKLYILSQLLQHECNILPGFVLGSNLLRQFLTDLDDFQSLLQELSNSSFRLDVNDYFALQSVANRSRLIINRAKFPQKYQTEIFQAARQLNSDGLILQPFFFLPSGENLGGKGFWRSHSCCVHPQAIAQTVKQVWSELFTAKSLLYWNKLGLSGENVSLAILVKPLNKTYASGTIEVDANSIGIQAVWGLEASILNGDVEADEYHLDRHTGELKSRYLGHKNYGYRIKNIEQHSLTECIEAYTPSDIYTETYVLDREAIATLLQLVQKILQERPQINYLVWTAPELNVDSEDIPNFFFTQFSEQLYFSDSWSLKNAASSSLLSPAIEPLLTGIAAAPGRVVAPAVVIKDLDLQFDSIPARAVLVTKNIDPHQIHLIKQVQGIITETGGKTSHAAIVARELNIPAIVSASDATTILQNGTEIWLHGEAGTIYPATAQQSFLSHLPTRQLSASQQSIATKLMVNISQPQSIQRTLNLPVDGVGLVRSELILADVLSNQSPAQWKSPSFQEQFTSYLTGFLRQLTTAFASRPIYYRSLDWAANNTDNSTLGSRGTYSYHLDSTLFALELKALSLIVAEGHHNLNLILPFVRGVEEFKFCYRQLQDIGLVDRDSFQVWIMAEVPSVIWLLPEYIRAGVRGIAIGTNDLTQLILAVDRQQADFDARGLNANHPAVQKAIAQLTTMARDNGIDCCVCGQAPVEYPELIDKLIAWGVTSISVEPEAVTKTYQAIARAEKRILLKSIHDK